MKKNRVIVGLDIGSGAIKIAIGHIYPDNTLEVLTVVESPSEGMSKGIIMNPEDVISSLSMALEKAEKNYGYSLQSVNVGISGINITSQDSRGVISVSRPEGEILPEDVLRAIEAAKNVSSMPNYQILHALPYNFIVENQIDIKDPVGMTGHRLEVQVQIIFDLTRQIKNLTHCLHRAGLEIDSIVFSTLAVAEAVLDKKQKELGVAILDLGETTTHLLVYEDGYILKAKVLPIGSRDITGSIAIALRSSFSLAESVKINYGAADYKKIDKLEKIDLKEFDPRMRESFSRQQLAKIIQAKCQEIFEAADAELSAIGRSRKLPSGIVLTGAGSKLPDIVEAAKDVFKLPCSLGKAHGFESELEETKDPAFCAAIGLLLWAKEGRSADGLVAEEKPTITKTIKSFFNNLFP